MVRRASLDYRDIADVVVHKSFDDVLLPLKIDRVYGTVPDGPVLYDLPVYERNDTIVFGSESTGLPTDIIQKLPARNRLRIPMMPSNRSLNLANAVAIIVYEMWRQLHYVGNKGI